MLKTHIRNLALLFLAIPIIFISGMSLIPSGVSDTPFSNIFYVLSIAAVFGVSAWIGALVRSARLRQTYWFLALLVLFQLGPIVALIYSLYSPDVLSDVPPLEAHRVTVTPPRLRPMIKTISPQMRLYRARRRSS